MAQYQQVNTALLEKISNKSITLWLTFLEEEFLLSINKYNNALTPGPDKLFWKHLKVIIQNSSYLKNIINIANTCINLEHWLLHFKISTLIIIPKPLYDTPKMFRPIVLLNMLGKLIEKVIGKRLQFQALSKNVIHLY